MPIARVLQPIKPNMSSMLLGIGVCALLVTLFFIPEIIDFKRSVSGTSKRTARVPEARSEPAPVEKPAPVVEAKAAREVPASSEVSPLVNLISLLDSGYYDKPIEIEEDAASERPGEGLLSDGVSWERIRSDKCLAVLEDARDTSISIARTLPTEQTRSRFALMSFTNGIRSVLNGAEATLTAEEALVYLRELERNVTSAMIQEDVDRGDLKLWQSVSLTPVFESAKLKHSKQVNLGPFNPGLTLTQVNARHVPNSHGKRNINAPVIVTMQGFVRGKDVKRLEICRTDHTFCTGVALRKLPKHPDFWVFKVGRKLKEPVVFRVYSSSREAWEKQYHFYPKVIRFPWKNGVHNHGPYDIPLGDSLNDPTDFDPRVDRLFVQRPGRLVPFAKRKRWSQTPHGGAAFVSTISGGGGFSVDRGNIGRF